MIIQAVPILISTTHTMYHSKQISTRFLFAQVWNALSPRS